MRDVVVAIDLETTGLDPQHDGIMEIGAVRIKEGQVIDEFSTFVNPEVAISERATLITGIKQSDVASAPRPRVILPDLVAFIGNAPIVGHSVDFDLGFLNKYGVYLPNTVLDTYDLASVILPTAARYNLHNLTAMFGISLEEAHRALDDARASGILYWRLYEKVLTLPLDVLALVNKAAAGLGWHAAPTFAAAYEERRGQSNETELHPRRRMINWDDFPPLQPNDDIEKLPPKQIAEIFMPNGELAQSMSAYEYRPQQAEIAREITQAFNESEHLLIEAGTGTGKSMAYLVPAVEWAMLNNERVIISTDTIALQDQLMQKDIPALQKALGINLRAAVLKGRSNYLCPILLEDMKRRGPTSIEELRVMVKILVWQLESDSGDKTEISLRGITENSIWNRLSAAEGQGCRGNACVDELGVDCPFYRAYRTAQAAHLVVVNHSLLVADARAENRVLPDYQYIVIDEAHHLEEAVTSSMEFLIDEITLLRRLDDLGDSKRGLLVDLATALKRSDVPAKTIERINDYALSVTDAANKMQKHVQYLFKAMNQFAVSTGEVREGEYVTSIRIIDNMRVMPSFVEAIQRWQILQEFMLTISEAANHLYEVLGRLDIYAIDHYGELLRNVQAASRYLQETHTQLEKFFDSPSGNTIYWVSVSPDGRRLSMHTAPLHVGEMIASNLWNNRRSVILTSATLRTAGSFAHIRDRIDAQEVKTIEVGSPFDYKRSTLLFLPNDMPDPSQFQNYQKAIERAVIDLATALDGRVLVLFTSYAQLRQTSKAITSQLALQNITIYDQSDGSSRQSLLEGFKTTQKAVLLGTRSFWEGIDIPGDSLSAVIITRLPFPIPSDPIVSARGETYDNSFSEFMVPEAILRFRQGFGRLIRSNTDRGIVVVLDSRIISKQYGVAFLDSLPDCTRVKGSLAKLSATAKDWLANPPRP
ncbi:MAG: helicase C-terminal domain-containing protein [Phototrophicaceae bacterium]|jgi:DNA polymerase-3 subunit epsilon/ATP-dependent DNA helicase DinG